MISKGFLIVCATISRFLLAISCPTTPSSQLLSLWSLYNSTNGEEWSWRNSSFGAVWNFSNEANPCCDNWQGVSCNSYSFVTSLELPEYNLVGTLTAELQYLSKLEILNLGQNFLSGTIPYQLGYLSYLLQLNISSLNSTSDNSVGLVGEIPTQLAFLTNLEILDLSANSLVGSVPPALLHLPNLTTFKINTNGAMFGRLFETINATRLQYLNVEYNRFSGNIPDSFGQLTSLTYLKAGHNHFTGSIPSSLQQLTGLTLLDLNDNRLNGTIPEEFKALQKLELLDFSYNYLYGSLPWFIYELPLLQELRLGGCYYHGSISDNIAHLQQLNTLYLSANFLTGTVPGVLNQLPHLRVIQLDRNNLTGALSSAMLHNMTSLEKLQVNLNSLTGNGLQSVCEMSDDSMLFLADLGNNNFSGTIPAQCNPKYLQFLDIAHNHYVGTVPHSIVNMNKWRIINLSFNFLNGSFRIGNWSDVRIINVEANLFTGPFPAEIGNCTILDSLVIDNNSFTGAFPPSIANLQLLRVLSISNNLFTGTIPEAFSALRGVYIMDLGSNAYTGPLNLNFSNLVTMQMIILVGSMLTGPIPDSIGDSPKLSYIYFVSCGLTGTLPAALGNVSSMEYIDVGGNYLTGTYPAAYGGLTKLKDLYLDDNYLSGTLPDQLYDAFNMFFMELSNNLFSGTISSALANFQHIVTLDLASNFFTGTIPESFLSLELLNLLYLNDNNFHGRLDNVDGSRFSFMVAIDVSNNQFSGPLPENVFSSDSLQAFAAVGNCLTGSISDAICSAPALTTLVLDGLHTAATCRTPLINSYVLDKYISGTVPACLFNMSTLQVLHLSGNGIQCSLPSDLSISSSLRELSLSNNLISGTIPASLLQHGWNALDLSFNTLQGTLVSNISLLPGESLSLQVNRLSGNTPSSLKYAQDINVLDGNLFGCNYDRSTLPVNDPHKPNYNCGSNTFNISFIVLGGLVMLVLALLAVVAVLNRNPPAALINTSKEVKEELKKINKRLGVLRSATFHSTCLQYDLIDLLGMTQVLTNLRSTTMVLTAIALLVFLPLYCVVKIYYETVAVQYAWYPSAAYIEGANPAIVLFAFFTCIIFSASSLWLYQFNEYGARNATSVDGASNEFERLTLHERGKSLFMVYSKLLVTALFNMAVIFFVNVGFVYITDAYDSTVITIVAVFVSLFKLIWNEFVIPTTLTFFREKNNTAEQYLVLNERILLLQTRLILFNNIICPILATSLVSANCFYYLLNPPASVTTYLSSTVCSPHIHLSIGKDFCTNFQVTSSYQPPYYYNYECTSSLITKYASIFVFMFTFETFGKPFLILTLLPLYRKPKAGNIIDKRVAGLLLPALLTAAVDIEDGSNPMPLKAIAKFNKHRFIVAIINSAAVLLTFGIIFPPIAVIICAAMISNTYVNQIILGRFIEIALKRNNLNVLRALDRQCKGISASISKVIWILLQVSTLIYSAFVFDIYANWQVGTVYCGVLFGIPTLLWCAYSHPRTRRLIDNTIKILRRRTPLQRYISSDPNSNAVELKMSFAGDDLSVTPATGKEQDSIVRMSVVSDDSTVIHSPITSSMIMMHESEVTVVKAGAGAGGAGGARRSVQIQEPPKMVRPSVVQFAAEVTHEARHDSEDSEIKHDTLEV